jgi:hypothetical protein
MEAPGCADMSHVYRRTTATRLKLREPIRAHCDGMESKGRLTVIARTPVPAMCVIIDAGRASRMALAAMLAELGCAAASSERGADIDLIVQRFDPAIIFLNISHDRLAASAVLRSLARLGYRRPIQLISDGTTDWRSDAGLDLDLLPPIKAPAARAAIQAVLASEGLLIPSPGDCAPGFAPMVIYRPWYRTSSGKAGLVDIRLRAGNHAGEALTLPVAVQYWMDHAAACRAQLHMLAAPAALVVDCAMADLLSLPFASLPADAFSFTASITEDTLFHDIQAARTGLPALRQRGIRVRVTGCGTRFLAMAGDGPLPVDQVVIDTVSHAEHDSVALKEYRRITETLRRMGAAIFSECTSSPLWLAAAGVDFSTPPQASWHRIQPRQPTAPAAHQEGGWRRIGLCDLPHPMSPGGQPPPFVTLA